jgi:archaellum component FlaC
MAKTKQAEQKIDVQSDLEDRLEHIESMFWRMTEAVEGMNESIEEINKELFRLVHLLEERQSK